MQLPAHITNLPPYTPIEPFEVLSARLEREPDEICKLDANENPYGMSPRARAALANLTYGHIYPDPESRALRTALAEFTGTPADNLLAGAGADELIDLIFRVALSPGDIILNCPPTFGMYSFDAALNNVKVIDIPRKKDFSLDLDGIINAVEKYSPKLIFISSPNNPDGSLPTQPDLQKLLALSLLIVLDEAYIEFAAPESLGKTHSQISDVPNRDNLVVLRTFSKLAGLAGLRVGYGAFPSWLMPTLWKSKQPYNVNVAASTAALASLEDRPYLRKTVATLVAERERLMAALQEITYLHPYPSSANFILCRVTGLDAAQLKADLAQKHGILIRYFDKSGLKDHIRISVGKPEQTDLLLKALSSYSVSNQ
ncbi:MAG: histidinol-phosphate transaminase [Anaerolineae bacterium]|nr:histidinol-phosphate transaminase [Anaerolineae bacterium]